MSIQFDATFWVAAGFITFFLLIGRQLREAIESLIRGRQETIVQEFQKADHTKQSAEGTLQQAHQDQELTTQRHHLIIEDMQINVAQLKEEAAQQKIIYEKNRRDALQRYIDYEAQKQSRKKFDQLMQAVFSQMTGIENDLNFQDAFDEQMLQAIRTSDIKEYKHL